MVLLGHRRACISITLLFVIVDLLLRLSSPFIRSTLQQTPNAVIASGAPQKSAFSSIVDRSRTRIIDKAIYTPAANSSSSPNEVKRMTVAARLCHGMGNQVSQIIYANYWKELLEEKLFPVKVDIVIYYCDKANRDSFKLECFPKLRRLPEIPIVDLDFWKEYHTVWLNEVNNNNVSSIAITNNITSSILDIKSKRFFAVPLTGYRNKCGDECELVGIETMRAMLDHLHLAPVTSATEHKRMSLPIFHTIYMPDFRHWDRYYDSHERLLEYDRENPKCCNLQSLPKTTDIVYHFRDFATELGDEVATRSGSREISGHQAAIELLSSSHSANSESSHIVVLSRFHNNSTQAYLQVLRNELKINVTLLTGQSDFQDYCFLQSASNIVGSEVSTFVKVAGFGASTSTNVRLYSLFCAGKVRWKRLPNEHSWSSGSFVPHNFTNSQLRERFHIVPVIDEKF